ncbi:MAG: hypothetical protein NTX42_12450 [Methanothrix sp.]|nr:hypothetical protein [Methanothrix sp.]
MVRIGCMGGVDHSGDRLSELNLTVIPDKEIVGRDQCIQIYFNIINIEKDVDAHDFNLVALLSKSLAVPSQTIRIGNENGKMVNESNEGKISIYSNFNNHNEGRGDSAEIGPDRIMKIHLTSLNKKEKILVKYITKVENETSQEPQDICLIKTFQWDYKKNDKNKLVESFKVTNNKPVITEFNVNVEPECNITCSNGPNVTVFRYSKINFSSKCYDSDNDQIYIEYFDKKIGSNIESGSEIIDLGTHQFQIKACDLIDNNFTNNSKFLEVVDLVEYHRSRDSYISLVQALFVAILILIFIHVLSKKPSIWANKQRLTIHIIPILIIPILILTHLGLYYYYFCSDNHYRSLVWIESSMMIVSFLLFTIYMLCNENDCHPLNWWNFGKIIIGLFSGVLSFHYFLPSILSQRILIAVLLAIFLDFLRFILVNRHTIKDTISPSTKELKYVFSWDKIPGKDEGRLKEFLTKKFGIDWVKNAKIERIENSKAIKVSTENNFLSLRLNDKKTEVFLEIDNGRTNKFIAKMVNDDLNIYELNSTISVIGMIIAQVAVISVIVYIIMPIPTFRPKLEILDLIIIEIMEVAWLIFIIVLGLYPDKLAEFINSAISIKEILKSIFKQQL